MEDVVWCECDSFVWIVWCDGLEICASRFQVNFDRGIVEYRCGVRRGCRQGSRNAFAMSGVLGVLQGNRKAVHKSEEPRDSDCTIVETSITPWTAPNTFNRHAYLIK
jgi:hypothetical protein